MNFDSLPTEIKYRIFSYFDDKDLRSALALVSKEWHEIARDPFLRKMLKIWKQDSTEIIQLLRKYARIRRLCCVSDDWQWLSNMPRLTHVSVLNLNGCRFASSSTMTKLLDRVPYIRFISTRLCEFNEVDCTSPLIECRFLHSIEFCSHVDSSYCPAIFLENCGRSIVNIDISCSCVTDSLFHKIIEKHSASVKSLHVCGERLTEFGYLQLNKCHHLIDLFISDAHSLTSEGLLAIKELHQLKYLCLGSTNADIGHLFHESSFPQLTYITLCDCRNLRNKSLDLLAESCPKLRYLRLSYCVNNLDDGLSTVIKKCSSLESLSLSELSATTGKFLSIIPSCLPRLKELKCTACNSISKNKLSQLKARRPMILKLS